MTPRILASLVIGSFSLGLAACADETTVGPPLEDFEELCGQAGPLRILPIDPAQNFDGITDDVFGGRFLFALRFADTEPVVDELWSVGMCGESPTKLAVDLYDLVVSYSPWPDIPFVCDSNGVVSAIDPTGATPAHPVFESGDCVTLETPDGLLVVLGDGETGPLVFQPWPSDPWTEAAEQIVLLPNAQRAAEITTSKPALANVVAARPEAVLAINDADELVSVAWSDLSVTVVASDVLEFDIDPTGRYILWQSTEVTSESDELRRGPVFVLDRESGKTTKLAETALLMTSQPFLIADVGILHLELGSWSEPEHGYFALPSLEPIDLPTSPDAEPYALIDDRRVLFGPFWGSVSVVDLETLEVDVIYEGNWRTTLGWTADGIYLIDEDPGPLVSVSYAGDIEILGEHVASDFQRAANDRIFTSFEVDGDGVGSLISIAPGSLVESTIATDVVKRSLSLREAEDTTITYVVASEDSEVHGIWRAGVAD